jgi:hypothetical protein
MAVFTQQPQTTSDSFWIVYTSPYKEGYRYQSFETKEEADRMIEFYATCGTKAEPMLW